MRVPEALATQAGRPECNLPVYMDKMRALPIGGARFFRFGSTERKRLSGGYFSERHEGRIADGEVPWVN